MLDHLSRLRFLGQSVIANVLSVVGDSDDTVRVQRAYSALAFGIGYLHVTLLSEGSSDSGREVLFDKAHRLGQALALHRFREFPGGVPKGPLRSIERRVVYELSVFDEASTKEVSN